MSVPRARPNVMRHRQSVSRIVFHFCSPLLAGEGVRGEGLATRLDSHLMPTPAWRAPTP